MPGIYRTVIPRIRKSLETHGLWGTLRRSISGPARYIRDYKRAKRAFGPQDADPFDLAHGVETSQRVHHSDLKTDSTNWVYAVGYWPTAADVVRDALAALPINHEEFTFIDLGSGKGRVLMMASDYPFARIVGVEFAPSLHQIAVENLKRYRSDTQRCQNIEARCEDMTQFVFPEAPLVVFLYNPASELVIQAVKRNLGASLERVPRAVWVIYVTPAYKAFEAPPFREIIATKNYAIYRAG